ncbi:MAG: T9SS type A sorting domain-containing protein [Candidatus Cyclonatronum sp.]|uniref:T9SS type A sorting domain-containing protein n=1 Tax=Cyclonatronum sp. TaxID=3024185 RepID=UPI0025BDA6D7|nr:T9SS type A sorting domain-containing protein [Cyclonatronum sp.]MCH8487010.1 T9SS type A sorting domain-containing protein [Cyclonatronum sp.]
MLLEEGFSYVFTMEAAGLQLSDKETPEAILTRNNPAVTLQEEHPENRFTLTVNYSFTGLQPETHHPQSISLHQNYPNPFNPVTRVQYALPEAADVRLEVFNLTGQRVATLVSGHQSAGSHTVSFSGQGLSSGIYLYRLQAGNQSIIRKMTLVK